MQAMFWVVGYNSKWPTKSLPLESSHSLWGVRQAYLLWYLVVMVQWKRKVDEEAREFNLT